MRVLIAAIHYPVASGRYAAEAFRRLGADVRTIGSSTGNKIWGMEVAPHYAWRSDGELTKHWEDWTPDIVVVMESAYAYHHPYYAAIPHVIWGVDNHVRNYEQPGIARYFLGHNAVSIQPFTEDVEWLPCAYDPTVFTPSPIAWDDREYDVALVGVNYQQRAQVMTAMDKAGLKVLYGTGFIYDQYRDIYHNAKVALSVSAAHDVAQRIFETAAMGCAVLTDELPDLAALNPQGITTFNSVEDAVSKAQKLVKNGAKQAAAGQAWALPHTWDARAARIMDWWQDTYAPKPKRKAKIESKPETTNEDAAGEAAK